MKQTVNAAAVQFNITLGDVARNLAKGEAALRRVGRLRVADFAAAPRRRVFVAGAGPELFVLSGGLSITLDRLLEICVAGVFCMARMLG